MQNDFTLEQKQALALAAARKRKAEAEGTFSTPQAALDSLGRDPGQAPEQPSASNRPFRDFFEGLATGRVTQAQNPGLADLAVNTVGNLGVSLIDRPVETLTYPLTAPQRAASGFIGASEDLALGNFKEAGRQALEGATAVGETALLAAPGASAASRAATLAPRPAATAAQQFVRDAGRVGVDPSLASAFPQTAGRVVKPLSENFAGGITARGAIDRSLAQSEQAVQRTADLFSDAGYRDAGRSAIEGVQGQLRSRPPNVRANTPFLTFREKASAVYDDAFSRINAGATAPATATRQTLSEINARFDNADLQELFRLPRAARLDEILSGTGDLTINDLRNMRTSIRELQNQGRLIRTVDEAALERLEGALTRDIFDGIAATSGREAANRLRIADRFYRQNITSIRLALKPFLKEGVTQEDAFREIITSSRGTRGDVRQLRALRRALTPQQMDDVSAGIIRQMGRAKDNSDFSPEVFARAWQDMSNEARNTLFNRAQRPEVREQLDALANVIGRQANVERLSNHSHSGSSAQNIGTAVVFGANPTTALLGVAGANVAGRLLMSPSFTRFVVGLERRAGTRPLDLSNARDRSFIYSGLAAAGNSDPAIKPYLDDIRAALDAQNDNLVQEKPKRAAQ